MSQLLHLSLTLREGGGESSSVVVFRDCFPYDIWRENAQRQSPRCSPLCGVMYPGAINKLQNRKNADRFACIRQREGHTGGWPFANLVLSYPRSSTLETASGGESSGIQPLVTSASRNGTGKYSIMQGLYRIEYRQQPPNQQCKCTCPP